MEQTRGQKFFLTLLPFFFFGCSVFIFSLIAPYSQDEFWSRLVLKNYASFSDYFNIKFLIFWIQNYWGWYLYLTLIISFLFGVGGLFLVIRKNKKTIEKEENPDSILLNKKHIKKILDKKSKPEEGIFAGKFGKADFYVSYEDRGIVLGPPGTGKTAFLLNQLLKLSNNKISFICADIKPEIHEILKSYLEKKGYEVLVLNPVSDDGISYNLIDDISSEIEINELVLNLLPVPPKSDPVWIQAEQWYLRLSLLYLFYEDNRTCSLTEAHKIWVDYPSTSTFIKLISSSSNDTVRASALKLKNSLEGDSRPEKAGYSKLFEDLNWLNFPTINKTLRESHFSINDLGGNKPIALFIQFEETKLQTLGKLLSVFYGHFLNCLINNHNKRGPVALFFDEIGNIPKIEGLAEKLNTIRSRNLPTWMYWQTVTQMNKYSFGNEPNGANIILGSSDAQIFFRNNAKETQDMLSALVGVFDKKVVSNSKGHRADNWELLESQKTFNRTVSKQRRNIIEPHEVMELKPFEVIGIYRGARAMGRATPYFEDFKEFYIKGS